MVVPLTALGNLPLSLDIAPPDTPFLNLDQCRAVQQAYRAGKLTGKLPTDTHWEFHARHSHAELLSALEAEGPEPLNDIANRLHQSAVLTGYEQNGRNTDLVSSNPVAQRMLANRIYAGLLAHGMALGTLRMLKPEQSADYPYMQENQTEAILAATRPALGITRPHARTGAGAFGPPSSHGPLSMRHMLGLGYVREIAAVLAAAPDRYSAIVEIGGGLGHAAYHASGLFGLPYTIIDLPAVGVTQHMMLMANGVESHLWPAAPGQRPGEVVLRNAFARHDAKDFKDALFVNFDSFVEMAAPTQEGYFRLMADAGADLLSVNHESDHVMTRKGDRNNWDLTGIAGYGYAAGPRRVFWEREGFVSVFFQRPRTARAPVARGRWAAAFGRK